MKVLVAHRDPDVRAAVAGALRFADAEIVEAADIKTALAACREHAPPVALVEVAAGGERGAAPLLGGVKGGADPFPLSLIPLPGRDVGLPALPKGPAPGARRRVRLP